MSNAIVEVEKRSVKGSNKLSALRSEGFTPGIIYGHNTKYEPQDIQIKENELKKQLEKGRKMFDIKGLGSDVSALVTEVQVNEITDQILHIDFQRVEKGDKVTVKIPLVIKGTPAGARVGGRFQVFVHQIKVNAPIESFIEEFVLDVSDMEVLDRVTLDDLKLPEGVSYLGQPTTTVCIVQPPKGARNKKKAEEESEDK